MQALTVRTATAQALSVSTGAVQLPVALTRGKRWRSTLAGGAVAELEFSGFHWEGSNFTVPRGGSSTVTAHLMNVPPRSGVVVWCPFSTAGASASARQGSSMQGRITFLGNGTTSGRIAGYYQNTSARKSAGSVDLSIGAQSGCVQNIARRCVETTIRPDACKAIAYNLPRGGKA